MAPPKDREAEARKEAGIGIGLADDLRSIRTALVKAKLAGDFEAAFDLALFQMGRAVFAPGDHDHALDIAVKETPDRPNTRMNDANFADWSQGEAMLADHSHLSFDWLEIDDVGESFAALRALEDIAMPDSVTGFDEIPLYDVPAAPTPDRGPGQALIREAASRRRLRARFLRAGRDAVDDRELLELLLFGRKAADHPGELTVGLLETFGSAPRVLAARAATTARC